YRQAPVRRTGARVGVAFGEIGGDVLGLHGKQAGALRPLGFQPAGKQLEVAAVGVERIFGQPLFQPEGVAELVDQSQIDCCCHGDAVAPSWRSSQRLTDRWKPFSSSWFENPPRPPDAVTRWQGTMSGNQFAPQAWPTARGAEPIIL